MSEYQINDIVNVEGYGGAAKIVNKQVDGVTPNGSDRYIYTVAFGPFAKALPNGIHSKTMEFYATRLSPWRAPEKTAKPVELQDVFAALHTVMTQEQIDALTGDQLMSILDELS